MPRGLPCCCGGDGGREGRAGPGRPSEDHVKPAEGTLSTDAAGKQKPSALPQHSAAAQTIAQRPARSRSRSLARGQLGEG